MWWSMFLSVSRLTDAASRCCGSCIVFHSLALSGHSMHLRWGSVFCRGLFPPSCLVLHISCVLHPGVVLHPCVESLWLPAMPCKAILGIWGKDYCPILSWYCRVSFVLSCLVLIYLALFERFFLRRGPCIQICKLPCIRAARGLVHVLLWCVWWACAILFDVFASASGNRFYGYTSCCCHYETAKAHLFLSRS